MNSRLRSKAETLLHLPGTEVQVTTEATTEADPRHAMPTPHGHRPPRSPMPTRSIPTRLRQFGRPGRKQLRLNMPGREVEPVGSQFQMSLRSSIGRQLKRMRQLAHSSHSHLQARALRRLLDLLLTITMIEAMTTTCPRRRINLAAEKDHVQDNLRRHPTFP